MLKNDLTNSIGEIKSPKNLNEVVKDNDLVFIDASALRDNKFSLLMRDFEEPKSQDLVSSYKFWYQFFNKLDSTEKMYITKTSLLDFISYQSKDNIDKPKSEIKAERKLKKCLVDFFKENDLIFSFNGKEKEFYESYVKENFPNLSDLNKIDTLTTAEYLSKQGLKCAAVLFDMKYRTIAKNILYKNDLNLLSFYGVAKIGFFEKCSPYD